MSDHSRILLLVLAVAASALAPCAAAEQEAPPPADALQTYRVGAGDRLDVHVFEGGPPLECLVRPDGRLTLPLAGDVEAAELTPPQLAKRIEEALRPFHKDPIVTVVVREINSYRVYVLGNVRSQMMVQSAAPLRVLQALAMAGGLNEFANKSLVVMRHRKTGAPVRLVVNYARIVKGEAPETDVVLEPGDILVAE